MARFFQDLWPFVRPYRARLIGGMACGVLFACTNALLMLAVKLVINLAFGLTGQPLTQQVDNLPGFVKGTAGVIEGWLPSLAGRPGDLPMALAIATIPAVMILRGVFAYLNVYLVQWAATRSIAELRNMLFEHLQNLSLSFFSSARTGELISRITSDTQALHVTVCQSLPSLVRDPVTVLALFVLLLSQQPKLTLLSMVVFPLCLVPILIYGRKIRKSARAMQVHLAELSSLMHESFTGNRIIKAYNLEPTVAKQFRATTRAFVSNIMRVVRANEFPSQLMEAFGGVGVALVFYYVVFQTDRRMTPGDFLQFIGSVFLLYQPVKQLSRLHTQLQQARAASERVFQLLETKSDVREPEQPVPLRAAGADIRFASVDFDYGEKAVLRNINLTIKAGSLTALVGASGSGKTTLTNLLLRFYDPKNGAVSIGGTDLRSVAFHDLRRQIALVTQETVLFNDTIRQNLRYGKPAATDAEIEAAARHAHAHQFIMEKPNGYESVIGEKGVALSGGQRQRLAIARAILKDAPILVLDEATSSLDSASERMVQAALDELMRGRTTLCIAHRLSTVQNADLIVVLDNGRIVETGTHASLLNRGGLYRKLHELQFSNEESPVTAIVPEPGSVIRKQ